MNNILVKKNTDLSASPNDSIFSSAINPPPRVEKEKSISHAPLRRMNAMYNLFEKVKNQFNLGFAAKAHFEKMNAAMQLAGIII
jgi:hypothetical protein